MNIYKNSEVSKKFGVSPSTVSLWVQNSLDGKNNLFLVASASNKPKIAKTQGNDDIMLNLKHSGNKYKPLRSSNKLQPKKSFYEVFDNKAIFEIINSMESFNEIPHKYTYFNKGALAWSEYVKRSITQNLINTVTNTTELMSVAHKYIDSHLNKGEKINIFDIGMGEVTPIKPFLENINNNATLKNYIGVDISPEMIKIGKENLSKWFGADFNSSFFVRDINRDSMQDIAFEAKNKATGEGIRNVFLFLETTIENQRDYDQTLFNLKDSMSKGDILLIMQSLDTIESRAYFDLWNKQSPANPKLPDQVAWIPEILNLNQTAYEAVFDYNETEKARYIKLRLSQDTEFEFEFEGFSKKVYFTKGSEITVWRHLHHKLVDLIQTYQNIGLRPEFLLNSKNQAQVVIGCILES
ncbi:MAG: hypothetical protein WCK98_00710 [bacterium]